MGRLFYVGTIMTRDGGRKRGRPATLTPELKLEREQARWRRKKAARRKRDADAKRLCGTNFGYFVNLWVPHYNRLTEVLVADGLLHEDDTELATRIDEAVDELFGRLIPEDGPELITATAPSRSLSKASQRSHNI